MQWQITEGIDQQAWTNPGHLTDQQEYRPYNE